MPTYDYECPDGHRFEVFQRMSDDPVAKCPECGAPAMRKISGGAGFLFKGEGFYITDYRSEEYKKKAASEPGSASSGATSDGKSGASDASRAAGGSSSDSGGSGNGSGSASGGSSDAKAGPSRSEGSPKPSDS